MVWFFQMLLSIAIAPMIKASVETWQSAALISMAILAAARLTGSLGNYSGRAQFPLVLTRVDHKAGISACAIVQGKQIAFDICRLDSLLRRV